MKETYYFSHDYNASQDPKMMSVLFECGLSGIGMYWILIELLHQQPNSKITQEEYNHYIDFYGRLDGESEHLLNKIKQVFINVELIKQEDKFVYSERVLKNKQERERLSELRSKAGKKSAEQRQNSTSVEQVLNKNEQVLNNKRKGKEIKDTTVAKATITFNGEIMDYDELIYEPLEGSKKKSVLGRSTMFILVRAYLDAKGIVLETGEQYDANKIGKGLSKLYNECKKDPDETIRRIKLGAEYFKSKELDWTPEAVWRRWEDINQWESKKYNSDLYE